MLKFISFFVAGRSILFVSPFLLSNYLSPNFYGLIESSIAMATALTSFFILGTNGCIPLIVLRKNKYATIQGVVWHHLFVFTVLGVSFLCCIFFGWSKYFALSILFSMIISMQNLASSHLKSNGFSDYAMLVEASLLGLLSVSAVYFELMGKEKYLWYFVAPIIFLGIFIYVFYFMYFLNLHPNIKNLLWKNTIYLGFPIMLGGIVSFFATTSGRLLVNWIGLSDYAAQYSVLSRAAALPIVAHQIITVSRFRDMFSRDDDFFKKVSLDVLRFVVLCILLFGIFGDVVKYIFGDFFVKTFDGNKKICFQIVIQSLLWSAIALNDLYVTRYESMGKVIYKNAINIIFVMSLFGGIVFFNKISIEGFVNFHSCGMLVFYCGQSYNMHKIGLKMYSVWTFSLFWFIFINVLMIIFDFV